MKTSGILKGLLLGTALLFATGAFAAEKASLTIYDTVTVAGKQLKPGDYSFQWEGNGPNVQVSILRNRSLVAVVPARMVEKQSTAGTTAYSRHTNPDGSQSLSQIQFHGKKFALDLSGDAGTDVAGK
jgi:hypothetical protein